MTRLAALAAAALLALSHPADAGDARAASERLAAAVAAMAAAEGARDRVAALTETIGAYEEGLAALRDGLRQAALAEAAIARRFEAESAELAALLGVLSALERTEAPLLLLHPDGALPAARAGMLASDVVPGLQLRVATLRADLAALAEARAAQEAAADTLEAGLRQVQVARTALGQAIADREPLPPRLEADAAAAALMAEGVGTLDAIAASLAALPAPAGALPALPGAFADARGGLPLPVQGTLLRRAGQPDAAGVVRPGIVLATRPAALVTAPWAGTIRYRGPLVDYGNVMVLEPDEGYLIVLAGLDIVYGEVGDVVDAGAPLGLMGGREAATAEFIAAARQGAADRSETLYLELRQGSAAVDPAEWFTEIRE